MLFNERFKGLKDIITGKFSGYFSIAGNTVLFILKMWAGVVTGSVALIADAWHTLSDSLSSVILLIGLYVSTKPADNEHPFGHGRAEIIASFVLGLILVLISINFLYESIYSIINYETVEYGSLAIIATVVSLVGKEIMAQISFSAAKKENFQSLKADGWHHRSDALTSAIILAGIILGGYIWWIDGALGIFVSITILVLAFRIVNDSINPLLGEKPDDGIIHRIYNISKEIYHRELYLHHFHIHKYGNHTEITFHIRLPGNYNLKDANQITSEFRNRIKDELNIYSTIYIDAYD
ncbi:MAG: cation diffusion facilitator family transporter [Cyclobacteriaceae bacterium]